MKLSQLHTMIGTMLAEQGDTENVALCLAMKINGVGHIRLDSCGDIELLTDVNFVNGMTCLVAEYNGSYERPSTKMGKCLSHHYACDCREHGISVLNKAALDCATELDSLKLVAPINREARDRVQQISERVYSAAEALGFNIGSTDPLDSLSTRTANSLRAAGLLTVDDVREAFDRGRVAHIPNVGKLGFEEVRVWLESHPLCEVA